MEGNMAAHAKVWSDGIRTSFRVEVDGVVRATGYNTNQQAENIARYYNATDLKLIAELPDDQVSLHDAVRPGAGGWRNIGLTRADQRWILGWHDEHQRFAHSCEHRHLQNDSPLLLVWVECVLRGMTPQRVTEQEIEAAKTLLGGWKRATLAQWGIPWQPPKGWRRLLVHGVNI
jgi:hypothetical protein